MHWTDLEFAESESEGETPHIQHVVEEELAEWSGVGRRRRHEGNPGPGRRAGTGSQKPSSIPVGASKQAKAIFSLGRTQPTRPVVPRYSGDILAPLQTRMNGLSPLPSLKTLLDFCARLSACPQVCLSGWRQISHVGRAAAGWRCTRRSLASVASSSSRATALNTGGGGGVAFTVLRLLPRHSSYGAKGNGRIPSIHLTPYL